ncbi:IS4 family transposase [Candidatus Tisiphia endosymbiont of Dioctria rufipes]|uniref:IS4 family transposase n=1 Tax=Candidatus Tisiphia endosymbiont of Dioctria rufipes TaxID=3066255 RepID=UPI00312C8261
MFQALFYLEDKSQEWQTLYIREHKTISIPKAPPTMKQAIIWLDKLGGFMNRKSDKLPGTMTLWRGYENLTESIEILSIFSSKIVGKSKTLANTRIYTAFINMHYLPFIIFIDLF